MSEELGHLSATIALDIQPFLTNQIALEAQIKRTDKLLAGMERNFKSGATKLGANSIFKTQIADLKMLSKQLENYKHRFDEVKKDFTANSNVENQRLLGTTANKLQTTALHYDAVRLAAAKTLQQQRRINSVFGRGSRMIGDYGSKLQGIAERIRDTGSFAGSAAIGAGLYNAVQSAIHFKSEIRGIAPLLSEDGRITKEISAELNKMSANSLKWSQKYGISTHSINATMTELARRGFTARQVLGSMPAILNATRASGESLEVVMQASASAIEMFGLKANTTSQQIKNTNRVVDVLTAVANKTASSFADISAGMMYVGPTAAQAHMKIEQVAAALGALSNRGIEASTAGTTLRQVLTKLTTDTKKNRANMRAIGVDIDQIKKKGIDLPSLIDRINRKLKDKTPTERMALLNQAFGKLGQGVLALFQKSNKSSKSAGQELRNLENELYHAGGVTKRIANEMNQTPEAKWKQFKQTLHATMIEVGGNMLPAFTGLMKNVQGLAQAFAKLDPNLQKAIVDFLAIYAAINPLCHIIAAPIAGLGNLESAFKRLYDWGAKLKGGSLVNNLQKVDTLISGSQGVKQLSGDIANIGSTSVTAGAKTEGLLAKLGRFVTGTGKASAGVVATSEGVEALGTATAGATATTATLGSSLLATAAGLGVVVAALGATYGAYKLSTNVIIPYINKKREEEKEIKLWGQVVGTETQKSIESFRKWAIQAKDAMNNTSYSAKDSIGRIRKAFNGMNQTINNVTSRQKRALSSLAKKLGGDASNQIGQWQRKDEKATENWRKRLQYNQSLATKITQNALRERRKLNEDERIMLNNIQNDMTKAFVSSLGVTKRASANIQKALSNTFTHKLSKGNYAETFKALTRALMKTGQASVQYREKMAEVRKAEEKGILSHSRAIALRKTIDQQDFRTRKQLLEAEINLMRNQGKSYKEIEQSIRGQFMENGMKWDGKAFSSAVRNIKSRAREIQSTVAQVGNSMSRNARIAGKAWNSLVFDTKTGKIKTNAKEVIKEFGKTKRGWNALKFIAKNAKIGTNGRAMIAEAAFVNGRWDAMSFKEHVALIATQGGKKIAKSLELMHKWNAMSPRIQHAVATAPNQNVLVEQLSKLKEWNSAEPAVKQILVNNTTGNARVVASIMRLKQWNSLAPAVKNVIVHDHASTGTIPALKKLGQWNKLPTPVKKLLIKNMTAKDAAQALKSITGWNKLPEKLKKMAAKDYASGDAKKATNEVKKWLKQRAGNTKHLKAKDNSTGEARKAIAAVKAFARLHNQKVVLTTEYVTIHTTKHRKKAEGTRGAWFAKPFANGTPYDGWTGGEVIVGDGHRKEVVYDPNIGLFSTPDTDTLMNLSKGSVIWRSVEAFERAMWYSGIKNFPHFANGTASQQLVALADKIPDKPEPQAIIQQDNSHVETQKQTNELIATLIEQNQQLINVISNLGLNINIDGRRFADVQAENNSKAIDRYIKQTGMKFS